MENNRRRSDLKQSPIPARTTSVDAHLGDGLFLLTAVVHAEIALQGEKAEALWVWAEDAGPPRRYQYRWVYRQRDLVLFAPSGEGKRYFYNYCARINAGGYRPLGEFPVQTDLRTVYLRGAELQRLFFYGADLRGADLREAILVGAHLGKADLSGANLRKAALVAAELGEVNLSGADLEGAFLNWAYLSGANLRGAKLSEATLSWAYLSETDLSEVDLSRANLLKALINPVQLELAKGGEIKDDD